VRSTIRYSEGVSLKELLNKGNLEDKACFVMTPSLLWRVAVYPVDIITYKEKRGE